MSALVPSAAPGPLAAASRDGDAELHVVFRVAGAEYALPVATVVQMESFTSATAVPGGASYLVGIMPVRGRVVPVVDLRVRFGLPAAPPTLDSRVVVGQQGDRMVALLADSAREVLRIAPGALSAPPSLLTEGGAAFVQAIAQIDKRVILVLDFARVIGGDVVPTTRQESTDAA